ncbi:hypothetical protein GCM10020256_23560 [Streptomyces thermocoprophilus]
MPTRARTGIPFTLAYGAVLAVTSLVERYADPGLVDALHRASSTDVAHLMVTPVTVLFASALWVAGGVLSPYALLFVIVLGALERKAGTLRAAGVFLTGHVLATLATEVPVGLAVLAGQLPDSSLHRLDYGISFGVAAAAGGAGGTAHAVAAAGAAAVLRRRDGRGSAVLHGPPDQLGPRHRPGHRHHPLAPPPPPTPRPVTRGTGTPPARRAAGRRPRGAPQGPGARPPPSPRLRSSRGPQRPSGSTVRSYASTRPAAASPATCRCDGGQPPAAGRGVSGVPARSVRRKRPARR